MAQPTPSPRVFETWFIATLVALLVAFTFLILYVGQGSIEITPVSLISLGVIVGILLTARWIDVDASRRGMDGRSWGRYALWFPLFTWVVYFIKRRRTPVPPPVP